MKNCIFCDIATGQAAADIIYKNASVICFLPKDIETYGHTLIMPRTHYETINDAPAGWGDVLFQTCQILSAHYGNVIKCRDFNLLAASGAAAEQSVPHLHFHYLPRRKGDGLLTWPSLPKITTDRQALLSILRITGNS
jgi:histidine triad (HIT) family protein